VGKVGYKAISELSRILKRDGRIRIFEPKPPHGIAVQEVKAMFTKVGLTQEKLNLSWRSFYATYAKN
jgi:ubiquinone/menaquinone biosynthesis C-methylase UbiE